VNPSRWLDSARSARHSEIITRYMTTENGRPMMSVAPCRVVTPPTISIAMVSRPVTTDQNRRSGFEPSCLESSIFEVKLESTRAPESAEVT
jgi:hypothetical protein